MSARRWEQVLWGFALLSLLVVAVSWTAEPPAPLSSSAPLARGGAGRSEGDTGRLGAAMEAVVARDPFRFARRPSGVAYRPDLENASATSTVAATRSLAVVVSGIVGATPWQAVLENVPGRSGSVVARVGDTFGDLRVRSIRRDTVVIQGRDTTWTLVVRGTRR